MKLPANYKLKEISWEKYRELSKPLSKKIFSDSSLIFHTYEFLTEKEKSKVKKLQTKMGSNAFRLVLAIFYKNRLVAWAAGYQKDAYTFYMMNSAVDKKHRRKGLYTVLLHETVNKVSKEGFIEITSRHNTTNNNVIIPKLKAGFVMKGLEVSENFGTLVHLSFYTKAVVRDVMEFRCGESKPSKKLKKILGI